MEDLISRLVRYVKKESKTIDLQFDPKLLPSLPFDPYSSDPSLRSKIAHYFLLVASVDEGNVVGAADNARRLLAGCHALLKEELFSSDQKGLHETIERLDKLGSRLFEQIPTILASVNSFVQRMANGNLIEYSKQFSKPIDLAEQISMNITRMGKTIGSAKKKTWMYMRWMVRPSPDLRLFDHMSPCDLYVPVDRNVGRVAACLNLLPAEKLSSLGWDDVVNVTNFAKRLFPQDPAKVDYPFFLLGRKLAGAPVLSERHLSSIMS